MKSIAQQAFIHLLAHKSLVCPVLALPNRIQRLLSSFGKISRTQAVCSKSYSLLLGHVEGGYAPDCKVVTRPVWRHRPCQSYRVVFQLRTGMERHIWNPTWQTTASQRSRLLFSSERRPFHIHIQRCRPQPDAKTSFSRLFGTCNERTRAFGQPLLRSSNPKT